MSALEHVPAGLPEFTPRLVVTAEEAKLLAHSVREMTEAVLEPGRDYGVVPGTDRPSLYKAGAEQLLRWFGFGSRLERVEVERDDQGRRFGVTYRCVVTKALSDGEVVSVASCEGYAGYDEAKWAGGERTNRRTGERYTVAPAPWNTIIQMAQKRALVNATRQATATSGLFSEADGGGRPDAYLVAARARLAALPEATKAALAEWRNEQRIPARSADWTPEHLCRVLIQAGALGAVAEAVAIDGEVLCEFCGENPCECAPVDEP